MQSIFDKKLLMLKPEELLVSPTQPRKSFDEYERAGRLRLLQYALVKIKNRKIEKISKKLLHFFPSCASISEL